MKKLPIFIFAVLLLQACNNNKDDKKPNSEIFDQYYQKNLNACMKIMLKNGKDSVYAREKCSCMIDNLYIIDSTFITKKGDELGEFISKNIQKVEAICGSVEDESSGK